MRSVKRKWIMILMMNNIRLEYIVLVGGIIVLDCLGKGDFLFYLEWVLVDGSKVRVFYVSEDGRILIDKKGKLEF